MTAIQPIERLSLRGRIVPAKTEANCNVWRSTAKASDGRLVGIYLKSGVQIQLFSDVVCSRLAVAAGLPTPTPFLVHCHRQQLEAFGLQQWDWPWPDDNGLLFGTSALEGAETFSRFLAAADQNKAIRVLRGWKYFWHAAWFDEWVANIDRHLGNILATGPREFSLIDHDQAFGGSQWAVSAMDSEAAHQNIIVDLLGNYLPADLIAANRGYTKAAPKFAEILLREAAAGVPFLSHKLHNKAVTFLAERIQSLPLLKQARLKDKQAEIRWRPNQTTLH